MIIRFTYTTTLSFLLDLLLIIVPEKYIYYDLKIISRNRRSFSKQRRPLLAQKNLKKIEHFDKSWHFLSDVDGYLPKNQIFGTGNQYQTINPFYVSSLKSIFGNAKVLIFSYKISIFAFTQIVLEQRYSEMIAP